MKIRIKAFGIARDILQSSSLEITVEEEFDVGKLRARLMKEYPDFSKLASLKFALNQDYVDDSTGLNEMDEVILIPPVSGG